MASIRKRGDTFTITAYMGYDEKGKQRKKTTTYKPPENVTPGKAEKLAKQYAAVWEEKIRGYSNITAKVISDRLGHSTTKTTLDTYSHVFAESEVKAMQAIDMALFHSTENETEKNAPNGTPLRIAK